MERSTVIRSPHLSPTKNQEQLIYRLAEKLERFFPRIVGCEVSIEPPAKAQQKGAPYSVRVDVLIPGADVHVLENETTDLDSAIRGAFATAKRLLEDRSQLRRRAVKQHGPGPREVQT